MSETIGALAEQCLTKLTVITDNTAAHQNKQDTGTNTQWAAPENLLSNSEHTAFPLDALSGLLGAAIQEVVDIVKCPPALAANSALSVLAVAAQGIANVQTLKSIPPVPLSLYLLSIGESGERKSTADRFFSGALQHWVDQKRTAAANARQQSESELEAWERETEGLKQAIQDASRKDKDTSTLKDKLVLAEQNRPALIAVPDLIHEDSTPEAIAFELMHTWASAGILSGEAGVVFGGHAMRADTISHNLSTLNKLWENSTITIKRRGTKNFTVRDVRLSMGLAVQPNLIQTFFDQNGTIARGSGFAARFLIAWPSSTQGQRFLSIEEATHDHPKQHIQKFHQRLYEMLDEQHEHIQSGGLGKLPTLHLSEAALAHWVHYLNSVEAQLNAGGDMEHYKDIASKSADNAARLAGLLHLLAGEGTNQPIQIATMEAATQLAKWYLYESRRFFSELAVPEDIANAVKLDRWLIRYCQNNQTHYIGKREVRQLAPNKLRNIQALNKVLGELQRTHHIRHAKQGRKEIIVLNPALLSD